MSRHRNGGNRAAQAESRPAPETPAQRQPDEPRGPLAEVAEHYGLRPDQITHSKVYAQLGDGPPDVAILTRGGVWMRWPRDSGRALTEAEKG